MSSFYFIIIFFSSPPDGIWSFFEVNVNRFSISFKLSVPFSSGVHCQLFRNFLSDQWMVNSIIHFYFFAWGLVFFCLFSLVTHIQELHLTNHRSIFKSFNSSAHWLNVWVASFSSIITNTSKSSFFCKFFISQLIAKDAWVYIISLSLKLVCNTCSHFV